MTDTTPAKSREHAQLERQYSELLQVCAAMKVERDEFRSLFQPILAGLKNEAYCSPSPSLEFARQIPQEVAARVSSLQRRCDTAEHELDELRAAVAKPFRGLEMDSAGEVREVGDGE